MKKILNILKSKTLLLGMIASCITTLAPSTAQAEPIWVEITGKYLSNKHNYMANYRAYKHYRGHMTGNADLAASYWSKTINAYSNLETSMRDLTTNTRLGWRPTQPFPKTVSRFEWQPERDAYDTFIRGDQNYEWSYYAFIHRSYNQPYEIKYIYWTNLVSSWYNAIDYANDYNSAYRYYTTVPSPYAPNWNVIYNY